MPDTAGTIPVPNTAGDLQQWLNLFTGAFGASGSSSSDSTSPEGLGAAMGVLPLILQMITSQDYSPDAAEKDSGPAVQLILKQALENGIPGISGNEAAAGGYDSTTAGLLKNDLASRSAAEGAALIAKNKATYGALRNGQTNSLINLINSIINANRQTRNNSTTPNLASNPAARNAALGALAAGAAGRALNKAPPPGVPRPTQAGRLKPLDNAQTPDDLPPEVLQGMFTPTGGFDIQSMDDIPDVGDGPTPTVTVENTGNLDSADGGADLTDTGAVDLFSLGDLGGDIGGDLGDGIAPGGGDESDGLDFGDLIGGGNDNQDGSDDGLGDTWNFDIPDNGNGEEEL